MADRAQKSGIAAEAQQKIYNKFEPPLAHEILAWISNLTSEPINTSGEPENFTDVLQDGLILCKLANALSPGSVKKVNTSSMAFKKMENISFFLNFAGQYVDKSELFQTVDLYEKQDPNAVLVCLSALARKSQKAFGKPGLGPKESEGEKRQFSDEVLRAGDSVIGLQMGSNKGASQSGMIMGNTRHM
ncbi:calponin homology (CH) domain-containing protein [Ditylenchus destructor]|uniref:Transgelin n=1 Tax=Ditylenchus destructor TaxID=166010 RepID=A0AAD4NEI7_9BILA|nr:calponin homology (CH) domain-containing protein [Ditylenchus destructor]